jgi:hypothetical protein
MGAVRAILARLEEGAAVDPQVQAIVTELLAVLPAGLPRPEIKYVDQLRASWLGACTYRVGADNTVVQLQRVILGDERTLRRIVAHELCHHAEFLVGWRENVTKGYDAQDFAFAQRMQMRTPSKGHGVAFRGYADLFNAKYGAGFVTATSDESFVKGEASRDLLVLMTMEGGRLMYAVAQRPGPKQRAYLARIAGRRDADTWRLVRTRDTAWTGGASIGNGYSIPSSPERARKLADLWNEGQVVALADM